MIQPAWSAAVTWGLVAQTGLLDVGETSYEAPMSVQEAHRLSRLVHDSASPLPWAESIEAISPSAYIPEPPISEKNNLQLKKRRLFAVEQAIIRAREEDSKGKEDE